MFLKFIVHEIWSKSSNTAVSITVLNVSSQVTTCLFIVVTPTHCGHSTVFVKTTCRTMCIKYSVKLWKLFTKTFQIIQTAYSDVFSESRCHDNHPGRLFSSITRELSIINLFHKVKQSIVFITVKFPDYFVRVFEKKRPYLWRSVASDPLIWHLLFATFTKNWYDT